MKQTNLQKGVLSRITTACSSECDASHLTYTKIQVYLDQNKTNYLIFARNNSMDMFKLIKESQSAIYSEIKIVKSHLLCKLLGGGTGKDQKIQLPFIQSVQQQEQNQDQDSEEEEIPLDIDFLRQYNTLTKIENIIQREHVNLNNDIREVESICRFIFYMRLMHHQRFFCLNPECEECTPDLTEYLQDYYEYKRVVEHILNWQIDEHYEEFDNDDWLHDQYDIWNLELFGQMRNFSILSKVPKFNIHQLDDVPDEKYNSMFICYIMIPNEEYIERIIVPAILTLQQLQDSLHELGIMIYSVSPRLDRRVEILNEFYVDRDYQDIFTTRRMTNYRQLSEDVFVNAYEEDSDSGAYQDIVNQCNTSFISGVASFYKALKRMHFGRIGQTEYITEGDEFINMVVKGKTKQYKNKNFNNKAQTKQKMIKQQESNSTIYIPKQVQVKDTQLKQKDPQTTNNGFITNHVSSNVIKDQKQQMDRHFVAQVIQLMEDSEGVNAYIDLGDQILYIPNCIDIHCFGNSVLVCGFPKQQLNIQRVHEDMISYLMARQNLIPDQYQDLIDMYLKHPNVNIKTILQECPQYIHQYQHYTCEDLFKESLKQQGINVINGLSYNKKEPILLWLTLDKALHVCAIIPKEWQLSDQLQSEERNFRVTVSEKKLVYNKNQDYKQECFFQAIKSYCEDPLYNKLYNHHTNMRTWYYINTSDLQLTLYSQWLEPFGLGIYVYIQDRQADSGIIAPNKYITEQGFDDLSYFQQVTTIIGVTLNDAQKHFTEPNQAEMIIINMGLDEFEESKFIRVLPIVKQASIQSQLYPKQEENIKCFTTSQINSQQQSINNDNNNSSLISIKQQQKCKLVSTLSNVISKSINYFVKENEQNQSIKQLGIEQQLQLKNLLQFQKQIGCGYIVDQEFQLQQRSFSFNFGKQAYQYLLKQYPEIKEANRGTFNQYSGDQYLLFCLRELCFIANQYRDCYIPIEDKLLKKFKGEQIDVNKTFNRDQLAIRVVRNHDQEYDFDLKSSIQSIDEESYLCDGQLIQIKAILSTSSLIEKYKILHKLDIGYKMWLVLFMGEAPLVKQYVEHTAQSRDIQQAIEYHSTSDTNYVSFETDGFDRRLQLSSIYSAEAYTNNQCLYDVQQSCVKQKEIYTQTSVALEWNIAYEYVDFKTQQNDMNRKLRNVMPFCQIREDDRQHKYHIEPNTDLIKPNLIDWIIWITILIGSLIFTFSVLTDNSLQSSGLKQWRDQIIMGDIDSDVKTYELYLRQQEQVNITANFELYWNQFQQQGLSTQNLTQYILVSEQQEQYNDTNNKYNQQQIKVKIHPDINFKCYEKVYGDQSYIYIQKGKNCTSCYFLQEDCGGCQLAIINRQREYILQKELWRVRNVNIDDYIDCGQFQAKQLPSFKDVLNSMNNDMTQNKSNIQVNQSDDFIKQLKYRLYLKEQEELNEQKRVIEIQNYKQSIINQRLQYSNILNHIKITLKLLWNMPSINTISYVNLIIGLREFVMIYILLQSVKQTLAMEQIHQTTQPFLLKYVGARSNGYIIQSLRIIWTIQEYLRYGALNTIISSILKLFLNTYVISICSILVSGILTYLMISGLNLCKSEVNRVIKLIKILKLYSLLEFIAVLIFYLLNIDIAEFISVYNILVIAFTIIISNYNVAQITLDRFIDQLNNNLVQPSKLKVNMSSNNKLLPGNVYNHMSMAGAYKCIDLPDYKQKQVDYHAKNMEQARLQPCKLINNIVEYNDKLTIKTYQKSGQEGPGELEQHNLPQYRYIGDKYIGYKTTNLQQVMDYKEPLGTLEALICRQAQTRLKPDKQELTIFKNNTQEQLIDWFYLNQELKTPMSDIQVIDFKQYVEQLKCNALKKQTYEKGYKQFFRKYKIPNWYTIVAKPDECTYKTPYKNDSNSLRYRMIFNPSNINKALMGLYNYNCIQFCKQKIPGFVQGYSTEQLEFEIQKAYNEIPSPLIMTYDGASHDAHQHIELLEIVDSQFHNQIGKYILNKIDIPVIMKQAILKTANTYVLRGACYYKSKLKKRIKLAQITLNGTVASGNATETTLGNTLRVKCYISHIARIQGIDKYKSFVAGDDVLCIIRSQDKQLWIEGINKIYSEEGQSQTHGLGLAIKQLTFSKHSIDFLSKMGYVDSTKCIIHRKPDRIITGGNQTVNKDLTDIEYKQLNTIQIYPYKNIPVVDTYIQHRMSDTFNIQDTKLSALSDQQLRYKCERQHLIMPEQIQNIRHRYYIPPMLLNNNMKNDIYWEHISKIKVGYGKCLPYSADRVSNYPWTNGLKETTSQAQYRHATLGNAVNWSQPQLHANEQLKEGIVIPLREVPLSDELIRQNQRHILVSNQLMLRQSNTEYSCVKAVQLSDHLQKVTVDEKLRRMKRKRNPKLVPVNLRHQLLFKQIAQQVTYIRKPDQSEQQVNQQQQQQQPFISSLKQQMSASDYDQLMKDAYEHIKISAQRDHIAMNPDQIGQAWNSQEQRNKLNEQVFKFRKDTKPYYGKGISSGVNRNTRKAAKAAYHAAMLEYVQEKFPTQNYQTKQGYEQFLAQHKLSNYDLPRSKYLELLAMDDIGILSRIAPLLMQYGPQIVSWIYDYFKTTSKPSVKDIILKAQDELISRVDQEKPRSYQDQQSQAANFYLRNIRETDGEIQPNNQLLLSNTPTSALSPYAINIQPGITKKEPGDYTSIDAYDYDGISLSQVAAFLYPEQYSSRLTTKQPGKTALAKSQTSFGVTTNAAGNYIAMVRPDLIVGAGTLTQDSFVIQSPDWVPATGAITPAQQVLTPGPLSPSQALIQAYRISSLSIVFKPTPSLNNSQGNVILVYSQQSIKQGGIGITPWPTQSQLVTQQFVTVGNMLQPEYRMIHLPDSNQDEELLQYNYATNAYEEGFFVCVVGGAATANVGTVYIYYNVEIQPTPAGTPIFNVEYPLPGQGTSSLETNLITMFPMLQCLPSQKAAELAAIVMQSKAKYQNVLSAFKQKSTDLVMLQPSQFMIQAGNPQMAIQPQGQSQGSNDVQQTELMTK